MIAKVPIRWFATVACGLLLGAALHAQTEVAAVARAAGDYHATSLGSFVPASAPAGQSLPVVKKVEVWKGAEGVAVDISISGQVTPRSFRLQNPQRIVLDLPDTEPVGGARTFPVGAFGVVDIRVGRFQANPPVTRVVVDLSGDMDFKVTPREGRIELRLRPPHGSGRSSAAGSPPPATVASGSGILNARDPGYEATSVGSYVPSAASQASKPVVQNVEVTRGAAGVQVSISASGTIVPRTFRLKAPDRIVVDLPNAVPVDGSRTLPVQAFGVAAVRIGRFQSNPPITRIVVDLSGACDFDMVQLGNKVAFRMKPTVLGAESQPLFPGQWSRKAAPGPAPVMAQASQSAPLPPSSGAAPAPAAGAAAVPVPSAEIPPVKAEAASASQAHTVAAAPAPAAATPKAASASPLPVSQRGAGTQPGAGSGEEEAETAPPPEGKFHSSLNGSASAGYSGASGNEVISDHGFDFGGASSYSGYYFSPLFLGFQVAGYYNQSRDNSDVQSIFDSTGVNASSQIFGGSRYPGTVGFAKDYNHEGEFGIPGVGDFKTEGSDQNLNVGWSLLLPKVPSLSAAFSQGSSNYQLLGTDTSGSFDSRTFNLHSGYSVAGFLMNAGFVDTTTQARLPDLTGDSSQPVQESSGELGYQFGVSRRLFRDVSFSGNYDHAELNSASPYASVSDAVNDASVNLHSNPISSLSLSAAASYSDNLGGSLLENVIAAGGASPISLIEPSTQMIEVVGTAGYRRSRFWGLQGEFEHREEIFDGADLSSNEYLGGGNFTHPLWGGVIGLGANLSATTITNSDSISLGTTASASYARQVGAWSTAVAGDYSRSTETALIGYTQSGYGYSAQVSRRIAQWYWNASALGRESVLDGFGNTRSTTQSYTTTFNGHNLSLNGMYSHSSGDAILTATGLVPTPVPAPVLAPNLIVLYGGTGYGGGLGWARGYFHMSASYTRAQSQTENAGVFTGGYYSEFSVQGIYNFRQIQVRAGYSRLVQGISGLSAAPGDYNTYFIGILRTFDFF
jgi:hypothetical protein